MKLMTLVQLSTTNMLCILLWCPLFSMAALRRPRSSNPYCEMKYSCKSKDDEDMDSGPVIDYDDGGGDTDQRFHGESGDNFENNMVQFFPETKDELLEDVKDANFGADDADMADRNKRQYLLGVTPATKIRIVAKTMIRKIASLKTRHAHRNKSKNRGRVGQKYLQRQMNVSVDTTLAEETDVGNETVPDTTPIIISQQSNAANLTGIPSVRDEKNASVGATTTAHRITATVHVTKQKITRRIVNRRRKPTGHFTPYTGDDKFRPYWRGPFHILCQGSNPCKPHEAKCGENKLLCNSDEVRDRMLHEHNTRRENHAKINNIANMHVLSYSLEREFLAFCATGECYARTRPKKVGCKHLNNDVRIVDESILVYYNYYTYSANPDSLIETMVDQLSSEGDSAKVFFMPAFETVGCARRIFKISFMPPVFHLEFVCSYGQEQWEESISGAAGSQCSETKGTFPGLCGAVTNKFRQHYNPLFDLYGNDKNVYRQNGPSCKFEPVIPPNPNDPTGPWPYSPTKYHYRKPSENLTVLAEILHAVEHMYKFTVENLTSGIPDGTMRIPTAKVIRKKQTSAAGILNFEAHFLYYCFVAIAVHFIILQ